MPAEKGADMDGDNQEYSTCPLCGRKTVIKKTGSAMNTRCSMCNGDYRLYTDREHSDAVLLYRKVRHTVDKGKEAAVKRKMNGELCVYEVDMKLAK